MSEAVTSTLRDRTELGGLPLYLPDQNAVLVGRVVDGTPDVDGTAAYYVHWRDGVYLGTYEPDDHTFVPRYALEADSRVMSRQANAFVRMDAEVELSSVGEALLDAYDYAETELLPDEQAHVYALRERGFGRRAIADVLNVSPSTVDSQRYSATDKVNAAEAFVSLRRRKTGEYEG